MIQDLSFLILTRYKLTCMLFYMFFTFCYANRFISNDATWFSKYINRDTCMQSNKEFNSYEKQRFTIPSKLKKIFLILQF